MCFGADRFLQNSISLSTRSNARKVRQEHGQMNDVHTVFSGSPAKAELRALAAELRERRDIILDSWRAYGETTSGRNVGSSLSRAQFNDHIPNVLDCLTSTLEAWPDPPDQGA